MNQKKINTILRNQRDFFQKGITLDVSFRIRALQRLKVCIKRNESAIHQALQKDLGKSNFESYMCETGMVYSEITYMLKHLRSFARDRRVPTPLSQFHAVSFVKPSPYGTVLIMSPWNYPFMLTMEPLVDALSAGNTAVVKPSAYSPHTSEIIRRIIHECFPSSYVAVVTGGRAENTCLLEQPFDYIFFTGSVAVGRHVMEMAARNLTPVTLELGGKSPVIVTADADLPLAARRIMFGKLLNAGQTCVAPDYLLVDRTVQEQLTELLQQEITRFLGETPLDDPDYPKIINEKHLHRLEGLLTGGRIVCGGTVKEGRIAPTLLDNLEPDAPVMQEEIFGPILPILPFVTLEEAMDFVSNRPKPLALYLFSRDKEVQKKVPTRLSFGGGCLNDTIVHLTSPHLPFGGVGDSGMGSYHGKASFDTFSHTKSILIRGSWPDLDLRYHPYSDKKNRMLRRFLR